MSSLLSRSPHATGAERLARRFDDREAVAAFLRDRIEQTRSNPFNQLDIATHAAYVGEPQLALEAFKNGSAYFAVQAAFLWTPLFREVRELDEFKTHMRDIGMVDVWGELGWPDLCEPTGDGFRCDRLPGLPFTSLCSPQQSFG